MLKLISRIQMGGSDILGCGGTDGATYLDTDLEISLNNFIVFAQVILCEALLVNQTHQL